MKVGHNISSFNHLYPNKMVAIHNYLEEDHATLRLGVRLILILENVSSLCNIWKFSSLSNKNAKNTSYNHYQTHSSCPFGSDFKKYF